MENQYSIILVSPYALCANGPRIVALFSPSPLSSSETTFLLFGFDLQYASFVGTPDTHARFSSAFAGTLARSLTSRLAFGTTLSASRLAFASLALVSLTLGLSLRLARPTFALVDTLTNPALPSRLATFLWPTAPKSNTKFRGYVSLTSSYTRLIPKEPLTPKSSCFYSLFTPGFSTSLVSGGVPTHPLLILVFGVVAHTASPEVDSFTVHPYHVFLVRLVGLFQIHYCFPHVSLFQGDLFLRKKRLNHT